MTEREDRPEGVAPPRPPAKSWRGVAIAGVAAAIGVAALSGLSRPASEPSRYAIAERESTPPARSNDPLVAELARCRTLAEDSADDGCRAAWEVNRRRFLGESRGPIVPDDPLPDRRRDQRPTGHNAASEER